MPYLPQLLSAKTQVECAPLVHIRHGRRSFNLWIFSQHALERRANSDCRVDSRKHTVHIELLGVRRAGAMLRVAARQYPAVKLCLRQPAVCQF